jgi:hypothetical protein
MTPRLTCGLALALSLSAAAAHADDPKFDYGKADELKDVKKPEWTATAEAGLVLTAGTAETTTATGGLKLSRKEGDNKFAFEASGAYAKSSLRVLNDKNGNGLIDNDTEITSQSTITAETINAKARYDRFLTAHNSLYLAALAARDLPAGKDYAVGGQFGYSRQLYKSERHEIVSEAGYDFSHESLAGGASNEIHSARGFVGYKGKVSDETSLDVSLELLTNLNHETLPTGKDGSAFKDTRANNKVNISSKVTKSLSVNLGLEFHFDNRPGPLALKNLAPGYVPEATKLDSIFKATLIYNFL